MPQRYDPDFARARSALVENGEAVLVRIEDRFVGHHASRQRGNVAIFVKADLAALDALDVDAEPAQRDERSICGVIGYLERDRNGVHQDETACTKLRNRLAPPDGASASPSLRSRWLRFQPSRSGCGMIARTLPARFTNPAQPSADSLGTAAASTLPSACA